MHWDKRVGAKFQKSLHRFLRIHVDLPPGRRVIGADRQQRDVDIVAVADFLESLEVGAVATMKNRAAIHFHDKSAEAAVKIGEKTRAPMRTRRKRHLERPQLHRLPVIELMNDIKTQVVDEVTDADRNDDRLISRDLGKGPTIEMIEMRVGDEDQIDRRQVMNLEARLLQSLDDFEPLRPDRIDQNIEF